MQKGQRGAAIRAGYSKNTARSIASENLSKPDILEKIYELNNVRIRKLKMSFDQVLEQLSAIDTSRKAVEKD